MLKQTLIAAMTLVASTPLWAQSSLIESDPFQLSTHILDISRGSGAAKVEVQLFKKAEGTASAEWQMVSQSATDDHGRIKSFLPRQADKNQHGQYKLVFLTAPYFKAQQQDTFYPQVEVAFNISDDTHYHVPITLSPFGYSTYRGN